VATLPGTRAIETIDADLRLVSCARRVARDLGAQGLASGLIDELLDERAAATGVSGSRNQIGLVCV
jgi:hypothetical protein